MTLDKREYTNGGARFYNFVVVGTYIWINPNNYSDQMLYLYIYNANSDYFMWYDVEYSTDHKYLTFVRP